jgi:2-polyprenyl-3-methyl-5-hydroxy-6-metoxy-1,4-benzoquinol methylase
VIVGDKNGQQKKCYLCGSVEFSKKPGRVRDRSELKILECASCGLVFLSSFEHITDGFYENSEMHGQELLEVQPWLKETEQDDERRFQHLKSVLPNKMLLEFGCGAGGFLLKARELAETVHGIELEKRLSDHYKKHGLSVFQNLSEIPMERKERKYDIIAMFHVLEHIPAPKSILVELSKFLADNGQIIVEVPNADDALLTLYNSIPFSNFTYWSCHLFLYTAKTLEILFTQIKLKTNYIKQVQRYPLSNHLYWLANGKPGGHQKWHFLDSPEIHSVYEKQLASIGKCDTIIASFSK